MPKLARLFVALLAVFSFAELRPLMKRLMSALPQCDLGLGLIFGLGGGGGGRPVHRRLF
jgi:hypothetical protein